LRQASCFYVEVLTGLAVMLKWNTLYPGAFDTRYKRKRAFDMKAQLTLIAAALSLVSCAGKPVPVKPVSGFDADEYLGTWYEIARLDHSFERGLTNVTANYSYREDGKIRVLNRGYNEKKGKYEDAEGKAKFAEDKTTGALKVSFFGPFYGNYIIFDLDQGEDGYSFVSGGTQDYLWLLARTPEISGAVRENFLQQASELGYDTDALIWVDQSKAK
jgi:apolipoprotein D and lipocalin family protein